MFAKANKREISDEFEDFHLLMRHYRVLVAKVSNDYDIDSSLDADSFKEFPK